MPDPGGGGLAERLWHHARRLHGHVNRRLGHHGAAHEGLRKAWRQRGDEPELRGARQGWRGTGRFEPLAVEIEVIEAYTVYTL